MDNTDKIILALSSVVLVGSASAFAYASKKSKTLQNQIEKNADRIRVFSMFANQIEAN